MKVTDVKTFVVDCFRTNWVFVKVYTDEGITGVGEGTLEYKEKALVGAVEHIKNYLVRHTFVFLCNALSWIQRCKAVLKK